jgi:hypothetical protein
MGIGALREPHRRRDRVERGVSDSQPRGRVDFAIFGTAAPRTSTTSRMRMLDRKLSSPHFLAVFRGGHALPPTRSQWKPSSG